MARVKVCPSCKLENSPDQPFCTGSGCGFVLADTEISESVPAPTIEPPESAPLAEPAPAQQAPRPGTWRASSNVRPVLKFPWGDVEVAETLFVGRDAEMSPIGERLERDGFGWVSGKHAEVYVEQGKLYVRDVGSKNGTFVNGTRLATQPVVLADGDQVSFSPHLVAVVRLG